MREAAHFLDCLAVAYRLDLDDDAWLRALIDASVPLLDVGLGVLGYTYESDGRQAVTRQTMTSSRFDPLWLSPFLSAVADQTGDPTAVDRPTGFQSWSAMRCGQASRVAGMKPFMPFFRIIGGAKDTFAINALDASGKGVWLGGPMLDTRPASARRVELFTRFAAHLTSAARLRRTAQRRTAAVLSTRGALLHAETEGAAAARDELRDATRAFHDARSRAAREDVDGATRRWKPLVESRWSLLDEFDTDGKRFVVAVENTTPTRHVDRDLSERELQVLTQAHLGHSNKVIAYELGLAASTVRVLLHRAARKLGVTSREAAIARFAQHPAQKAKSPP